MPSKENDDKSGVGLSADIVDEDKLFQNCSNDENNISNLISENSTSKDVHVDKNKLVEEIASKEENENDVEKLDSQEKSQRDTSKTKPFRIEDEPTRQTDEDGWLDILGSGDLRKRVIRAGEGVNSRAQRGQWVSMHYVGKLEDGTVVEKDNLKIIVGDSDIVQGLDLSIALMEKGEVAEVVVPSRLAYGKLGNPPRIPPDSVINYEVEIVDVQEADDEENLPLGERQRIGNEKKERGNFWYTRGDYSTAVHCYRRALDFLDSGNQNFQESAPELQKLLDMRLTVYNNLAAAQLKMDAYEAALKSVDYVLTIQSNNVKALFRKGKILVSKGQIDEAIDVLKKALKLEPGTKIIHQELSKLTSRKKKEETETRAMYKRMFETKEEKQKASDKKHKLFNWTMIAGGVLTVACAVALYRQLNSSG